MSLINDKTDVKILLLAILRRLPEPIEADALAELAMACDSGITYFDVAECLSDLRETEHLARRQDLCQITPKGERDGGIIEVSLPRSVRVHAERAAAVARARMERRKLIRASREVNREGGYTVRCAMSDGVGDIIALELYAADEEQAMFVEEGFRRNAEAVYRAVLDSILLPPGD